MCIISGLLSSQRRDGFGRQETGRPPGIVANMVILPSEASRNRNEFRLARWGSDGEINIHLDPCGGGICISFVTENMSFDVMTLRNGANLSVSENLGQFRGWKLSFSHIITFIYFRWAHLNDSLTNL